MTNQKTTSKNEVFGKAIMCLGLSTVYIAALAWPFGLSEHGYVATRAILAGSIMFAISVPVWVINIKRELASAEEKAKAEAKEKVSQKVGHLA